MEYFTYCTDISEPYCYELSQDADYGSDFDLSFSETGMKVDYLTTSVTEEVISNEWPAIDPSNNYILSISVKCTDSYYNPSAIFFSIDGYGGITCYGILCYFYYINNRYVFREINGNSGYNFFDQNSVLGNTYNLSYVKIGSNIKIYVDDNLVYTVPYDSSKVGSVSDWHPALHIYGGYSAGYDTDHYISYLQSNNFDILNVDFIANPTRQAVNHSVNFTDLTTGEPTNWLWTFGDGETSTEQSPTHIYTSAGIYIVTLTCTQYGETYTETKTSYITIISADTTSLIQNATYDRKNISMGNKIPSIPLNTGRNNKKNLPIIIRNIYQLWQLYNNLG